MRTVNHSRTKLFLWLTTLILALWFVFNPSVSVNSSQKKGFSKSWSANLTGFWISESMGTYYVRQVETTVWWMGQSSDGGASFTNVFYGTKNGDQITGFWADLPAGRNRGSGSLTLSVSGDAEIRKVSETGGFGEGFWKRRSSLPSPITGQPQPPSTGQPQPNPPGVCTISGRVIDNRPYYQTTLRLVRSDGSELSSKIVMGGEYRFTNVPEGTYEVRAKKPGGSTALGVFSVGSSKVTCEPNGSHTLDFKIDSNEG